MNDRQRIETTIGRIAPVDAAWIRRAEERQRRLTKPAGSLGRLEEIANRCAAICESLSPAIVRPRIVIFAADHGVCAEGVNPYPQDVTAQMVRNFASGGAAINALAAVVGARLHVVDVGVAQELPELPGVLRRRVAPGTRNFCREPAMSREEAAAAITVGIDTAEAAVAEGCDLLAMGEMGIGNSTAAAAVAAALTGLPAASVTGRGTGADDACLARKTDVVTRAVELHGPHLGEPVELLRRLGGLEFGALCGLALGGAAHRRPVVVDGFIATAAAALAVKLHSGVAGYLFAAHRSTEPGHSPLLELIRQRPLLDLGMRLGEGTGAALAIGIIRSATNAFSGMATFESAGVAEKREP